MWTFGRAGERESYVTGREGLIWYRECSESHAQSRISVTSSKKEFTQCINCGSYDFLSFFEFFPLNSCHREGERRRGRETGERERRERERERKTKGAVDSRAFYPDCQIAVNHSLSICSCCKAKKEKECSLGQIEGTQCRTPTPPPLRNRLSESFILQQKFSPC